MTPLDPAMKAGRELDVLVLEKVFCWQRAPGGSLWSHPDKPGRYVANPHGYSTDIAAAWKVVEEMEAEGWDHVHGRNAQGPGVEWGFMQLGKGAHSVSIVSADTVPLAICLSALKTVETP